MSLLTVVVCDVCGKEDRKQISGSYSAALGIGTDLYRWDFCDDCWDKLITFVGCNTDGSHSGREPRHAEPELNNDAR